MILVCFELSMPSMASWNGRWSGEDKLYAVIRSLKTLPKKDYYSYEWSDGWRAGVSVRQVDSKEAAKIRRNSSGFCGYDWMVTSIIDRGKIETSEERNGN